MATQVNARLLVSALALGGLLGAAPAAAKPPCPKHQNQRTPEQVLDDHRAALAAGNIDLAMCDFDDDAVVIHDGGVDDGKDQIRASLTFLAGFFGGVIPQVNEQVVVSIINGNTHMARVLFSVSTTCVDVPDGADTYIIKNGHIHGQTAHGFPVFKCGPPPGPPPG